MIPFILWTLCCCLLLGIGIYCFRSKKPVGFFANARTFPVKDITGYNRACGKLWIGYSLISILCGLPLLSTENPILALVTVLGVVLATLGMILSYVLVIEKKYRDK